MLVQIVYVINITNLTRESTRDTVATPHPEIEQARRVDRHGGGRVRGVAYNGRRVEPAEAVQGAVDLWRMYGTCAPTAIKCNCSCSHKCSYSGYVPLV